MEPADAYRKLLGKSWETAKKNSLVADAEVSEYAAFRDKPVEFVREVIGHHVWEAQAYILESLIQYRRVAVRSCRRVGKTFGAADLVVAFNSTGPGIVITTAPTGRQVRELLWANIRTAHAASRRPLPGNCGVQAWRISSDWYALGFSSDEPENFLGFHAGVNAPNARVNPEDSAAALQETLSKVGDRRLLILIDEAPGVDQAIFDVLQGSLVGPNAYCLIQGNPVMEEDDPHFFAQAHRNGSSWHRVHIAAEIPARDTMGSDKHFHSPPDWLLPRDWVDERRAEWGENSPLFRAHCLGCFADPGSLTQSVMPKHLLESALSRGGRLGNGERHVGVDIARFGGDECVAALWVDGVKRAQHVWSKTNLMQTADILVTLSAAWGKGDERIPGPHFHVDTGMGAGVIDRCRQMGLMVDEVDFGSKPRGDWKDLLGEIRPLNRRAELHLIVRRAFEEGLGHLPRKWEESWFQAQWAQYEIKADGSSGSVMKVEPKDDIRTRYGRSPDHWDADLLAWARSHVRPTFGLVQR